MNRGELGASLDLDVQLIPEGRPNRPGTPITVEKITVHNTSNTNPGADAESHSGWLQNTGYYEINGEKHYVSWHYTVDDHKVIKQLPISEKGWHAGRGNSSSLGIEVCMYQGINQDEAFDKASRLIAVLLYDLNLSLEDVVKHEYWTGKNCPILLLDEQKWSDFKNQINSYLEKISDNNQNNGDENV
jgi:N-acetylmuramoyl-L-alanine amidase CwlA